MSSTIVYGCDWCGEIIEKGRDDRPRFAAAITTQQLNSGVPVEPVEEKICQACRQNLQALREGKVRR